MSPHGHSWEREGGKDVYCMLREMQTQLGNLQGEVAKVLRCVGANEMMEEIGHFGGRET